MKNPYVMNMFAKERQAEVQRKAEMYRWIRDAERETGKQLRGRSSVTPWSFILLTSLLGFFILTLLIA